MDAQTVFAADFQNQGGYNLVKKCDKDGSRTIGEFFTGVGPPTTRRADGFVPGVLMKPDHIAPGDQETWMQYLRGRTVPLKMAGSA